MNDAGFQRVEVPPPKRIVQTWIIPIVMLVLATASIAVMVAVSRKPQKRLDAIATGHISLMGNNADLLDRVVVMLGIDTVLALTKTTYELRNTGGVPVVASDFETQPYVVIPQYVDYYTLEVTAASPSGPKATTSTDTLMRTATLSLGLLNPGEWVRVDLVMAVRVCRLRAQASIENDIAAVSRYLSTGGHAADAVPAFRARIVDAELRFFNASGTDSPAAGPDSAEPPMRAPWYIWAFVLGIGAISWGWLAFYVRRLRRLRNETAALISILDGEPHKMLDVSDDPAVARRLSAALGESWQLGDLTRGAASVAVMEEERHFKSANSVAVILWTVYGIVATGAAIWFLVDVLRS
jgi:hypothetical protein